MNGFPPTISREVLKIMVDGSNELLKECPPEPKWKRWTLNEYLAIVIATSDWEPETKDNVIKKLLEEK